MRKLFIAIVSLSFIVAGCSKSINSKVTRSSLNDPPVIKLITPTSKQVLKPYDQLKVKAIMTDIDLVAVASWEALNAALACGANPYMDEVRPMTYDHEMSFSFTIPPAFPGEHVMRLYAVDASGNISTLDIPYRATN
jgi:hypothetical protein